MLTFGLFYGSSTCYTEMAAEKIRDRLGAEQVQLFDIGETGLAPAAGFSHLIFGIPTWDYGELQEDWEDLWPELTQLQLQDKTVALFGLGDQIGYSEWFVDALGYLHEQVAAQGARIIGYWPSEGYEFKSSRGLLPGANRFAGLVLDEENQFELSEERIAKWCEQILREARDPSGR